MIGSSAVPRALARADDLLKQGLPEEAAAICLSVLAAVPDSPAAAHLLGLARARLGAPVQAEQHLRRSLKLEPDNHQFRVNFGNFLRRMHRLEEAEAEYRSVLEQRPHARIARKQLALTLEDLGRFADAEAHCRQLLTEEPRDAEAWSMLGTVLARQTRLLEAETAYRRALELLPDEGLLHQRLGSLLARLERAEEALASLGRARSLGVPEAELRLGSGRALTALHRLDEAEAELARAAAERPRHVEVQLSLARVRFLRADAHFTRGIEEALVGAPDDLTLHAARALVSFRAGQLGQTEAKIRAVLEEHGALPEFQTLLAGVLLESGRLKEAETEALAAATAQPRNGDAVDLLVAALLARGRPEEALPFILTKRAQEPLAQHWIAHEAVAARLLGKPQYGELFDYRHFVRAYRPEPPRGWSSMQELNAALLEVLRARFVTLPPLEHSLRHGRRTLRTLTTDPDPVIQAALASFAAPIERYLAELPAHPTHPFLNRKRRGVHIADGWAIELGRDGFHVNHVHRQGWISASYYVAVPEEAADSVARFGWLKFGEPRHPVPGVTPDFMVQPSAGLLVLHPSYLWHGTTPIHGDAPRTTLAFEVMPAFEG